MHEDNEHCASQERSVTMNMMLERAGWVPITRRAAGDHGTDQWRVEGDQTNIMLVRKRQGSQSKSKECCVSYSNGDVGRATRRAAWTKGNA